MAHPFLRFLSVILLGVVCWQTCVTEVRSDESDEPLITVLFRSDLVADSVPKIEKSYALIQEKMASATAKPGEPQTILTKLRQEIGPSAMKDPYIGYLVAVIECDCGLDRATRLRQLADGNTAFWEAWQATVAADLVFGEQRKAIATLRRFNSVLVKYCEDILSRDFNESNSSFLDRAGEYLQWSQDTAQTIVEFDPSTADTLEALIKNEKLTKLHQQILEYGTTKEGADDAKAKSEVILEKRRTDRLTARKKMATDLVKRWSLRVEDGWDAAVKQYNEVEKLLRAANDNYVSAQKNLANAARPYEQANANLRSARASMNAQAIAAAASDVQRYEPAFLAAQSAESKAKSKLADATRRYERISRSMIVRTATAANFNRSFSFRFRDILDSDPAIATQFNGLKAKQLALDYDRFAPKPVDASQLSDRARAKMRQMELALRIPISIDDILEVAKDHAKNSEQ